MVRWLPAGAICVQLWKNASSLTTAGLGIMDSEVSHTLVQLCGTHCHWHFAIHWCLWCSFVHDWRLKCSVEPTTDHSANINCHTYIHTLVKWKQGVCGYLLCVDSCVWHCRTWRYRCQHGSTPQMNSFDSQSYFISFASSLLILLLLH